MTESELIDQAKATRQFLIDKGVHPDDMAPVAIACGQLVNTLHLMVKLMSETGIVKGDGYFIAQAILLMALKTSEVKET